MRFVQFVSSLGAAGVIILIMLAIGWVANVATLVNHANDPITTITVLRGIGILVFPLGGVLGYL